MTANATTFTHEQTERRLGEYLVPQSSAVAFYKPLDEAGLFKKFCQVDFTSKDSILGFAGEYGRLSTGIPVTTESGRETWGEDVGTWGTEGYALRTAVGTWNALRSRDEKALQSAIKWETVKGHPHAHFLGEHWGFSIGPRGHDPQLLAGSALNPGNLFHAAAAAVNVMINEKLREHAAIPQLHLRINNAGPSSTFLLTPTSLISALWIQFAYVVEGNIALFQCDECRKWIETGAPGTSRADKRFCSRTCKARAHKKKQQRARDLWASGTPSSEIAKLLETTVLKVKGWIK